MIPFSPPRIDERTIEAVTKVLRSGWITTGPQTREFERRITQYTDSRKTLCLNSWTNAAELALRWYGIGPGDEVLIPAYTYAATANIVVHLGAKPVMVDSSQNDFNVIAEDMARHITAATKAIIPVDIGGLPCDYGAMMKLASDSREKFIPANKIQEDHGRILVMSDSAHSFGARYQGKVCGSECDIHGFSFHAVKNLTTAEGGALTFNLNPADKNEDTWKSLNISALHGQTKDALSKSKPGDWKYDIVEAGYKCNMTDILAAIGLVELERYEAETLPRRKKICNRYHELFSRYSWYVPPVLKDEIRESSYHLFMLRVNQFNEEKRDRAIQLIAQKEVSVNVHFQPLPLLTYYNNLGYRISDFPNAHRHYAHEISLPVYFTLSDEDIEQVADAVIQSMEAIL